MIKLEEEATDGPLERVEKLLIRLLLGIDFWECQDEGMPEPLWSAYEAARAAIGHPLVIATVNGWEGRYQSLQGALDGEEWPPTEEADPDAHVLYQPAEGVGLVSGYVQGEG